MVGLFRQSVGEHIEHIESTTVWTPQFVALHKLSRERDRRGAQNRKSAEVGLYETQNSANLENKNRKAMGVFKCFVTFKPPQALQ